MTGKMERILRKILGRLWNSRVTDFSVTLDRMSEVQMPV